MISRFMFLLILTFTPLCSTQKTDTLSVLIQLEQTLHNLYEEKVNQQLINTPELDVDQVLNRVENTDLLNIDEEHQWIIIYDGLSVIYKILWEGTLDEEDTNREFCNEKLSNIVFLARLIDKLIKNVLAQPFEETEDLRVAIISLVLGKLNTLMHPLLSNHQEIATLIILLQPKPRYFIVLLDRVIKSNNARHGLFFHSLVGKIHAIEHYKVHLQKLKKTPISFVIQFSL